MLPSPYRSTSPVLLLAGCALLLIACGPKESAKQPVPAQTTPTPGGPGGDDERPVTMLGGSFILTWNDCRDCLANNGVYKFSNDGGTLNGIQLELRDRTTGPPSQATLELLRMSGQPLKITVDIARNPEVTFTTDANGKNLKIARNSTGDLTSFVRYKGSAMEHPEHEKKITKISFSNVGVSGTGPRPSNCTVTGTNVVCSVDAARSVRTALTLMVCNGSGCPNPQ